MLRLRSKYLHLVTALELVAQGYELMVDFRANAMTAKERVYLESEVQDRTVGRHGLHLALWREDENLACEEIKLDGIEKVHRIGLWVIKNFLDSAEPVVQLSLVLMRLVALLVFPVGGETLFGNLVHAVASDLHLYPSSLLRHERHVQGLIAVGFRMV